MIALKIQQWTSMQFLFVAMSLSLTPVISWADNHTSCTGTHECAQKMLSALASLSEADAALADSLDSLRDALKSESEAHTQKNMNTLAEAKAYIDQRFTNIGTGNIDVPGFGTNRTDLCKAGFYMVGARVTVADGANAGMLYHGLVPICRRMK